ncbi:MAG TPA: hypothetical protein VNM14_08275 [Planctomycetota bacterium]|jgi:Tol biopolymer transport system component|nr:hypothetical protein [Planctomycetota bacterium]
MKPSSAQRFAVVIITGLVAFGIWAGCNQKKINGLDPALQATVRVSLSSSGAEGNLDAVKDTLGISNNGRFVSFTSRATNLVPGDTNNCADVFYRDNLNRTLTLVSISRTGGPADGASGTSNMSGDGRYVVFSSVATNLTFDVVPVGKKQIYVRDMVLGTTTLVSRASGSIGSLIGDENSDNPKISNDGVYVVFESESNLLDGAPGGGDDNDTFKDIYRRKIIDGTSAFPTELISFISGATSGAANKGNGHSTAPCISSDGHVIAFTSEATNLVSATLDGGPDQNLFSDVFVRDTGTLRTVRISVEYTGVVVPGNLLNGPSRSAAISLDGELVTFRSTAGTLHVTAQDGSPNIYVRSWSGTFNAPFTEVLSVHTSGATGGQSCEKPSICGDGSKVVWQSGSSALVNGDSNGVEDVFLRNRITQDTSRQSVQTFGGQLDGESAGPAFSADGRYFVFWSKSTNTVDDDTNGAADIFLRGPPFK